MQCQGLSIDANAGWYSPSVCSNRVITKKEIPFRWVSLRKIIPFRRSMPTCFVSDSEDHARVGKQIHELVGNAVPLPAGGGYKYGHCPFCLQHKYFIYQIVSGNFKKEVAKLRIDVVRSNLS